MWKKTLKIVSWVLAFVVLGLGLGWLAFVPSPKEPGYKFISAWGSKGAAHGQFNDPTGIAIAADEIFVSDARNGRIQVFGLDGSFRRSFGRPGKKLGELGRPMNLAAHNGKLYVPEYFNDRIQVFALDGMPQRVLGKAGSGPGEFSAPGGVGVGLDGTIYVADFYNQRIQQLSKEGVFRRQWGKSKPTGRGSGLFDAVRLGDRDEATVGVFSYPTDVAIAADGTMYVADGYNDRVQVFNADGTFSHMWGGPFAMNIHGPFRGWFATVTSIAIGPKGNIFVVDFYNHRVQKFAPDGTFLTTFGRRGDGKGEFNYPITVAIAGDGTVFVADYGNNRISKWRSR